MQESITCRMKPLRYAQVLIINILFLFALIIPSPLNMNDGRAYNT